MEARVFDPGYNETGVIGGADRPNDRRGPTKTGFPPWWYAGFSADHAGFSTTGKGISNGHTGILR